MVKVTLRNSCLLQMFLMLLRVRSRALDDGRDMADLSLGLRGDGAVGEKVGVREGVVPLKVRR